MVTTSVAIGGGLAALAAVGVWGTVLLTQPEADPAADRDVTLVATGDIACDPAAAAYNGGLGTTAGCRHQAVAAAVRAAQPDVFVPLGDLQYDDATYEKFMASYDTAFGDLKDITRPIPGNHEYKTPRAAGYYEYFGEAAHEESAGTYSYDIGDWHVVAINSITCTDAKPCGPGSEMAEWIAADLAANSKRCTMAVWHHPVWSAGRHGGYAPMVPVWNQLHAYGVDLVLTAHDHLYQRFQPLDEARLTGDDEVADPVVAPRGMVQFVVGTGGENNYRPRPDERPGVTAALAAVGSNSDPAVFGALRLTLRPDSYEFSFVPAEGTAFADAGSAACRPKNPPAG